MRRWQKTKSEREMEEGLPMTELIVRAWATQKPISKQQQPQQPQQQQQQQRMTIFMK